MGYKATKLMPIRFIASISHIIIAAIILMDRNSNIYGCGVSLASNSSFYTTKDTEMIVALSLMIGLCCLELIPFFIGISIYSILQSFLCIGFHLAATFSLLYFLFNRTCSDRIWPIFATCTCIPFFTEIITIISVCAFKNFP